MNCGYRLVCSELNCGFMSLCDLPPFLAKRLTDTLSPFGDVIGQYAACRIDALWFFGLMCGDSGSAVSFLHAAFFICGFVRCILLCAFRVVTDAFASLYVSEFFFAACGVSPLRGRPALAKAQGLDPNAFSFGCGFGGAVHLNIKSERTTKAMHSTNKKQSPLCADA